MFSIVFDRAFGQRMTIGPKSHACTTRHYARALLGERRSARACATDPHLRTSTEDGDEPQITSFITNI